MSNFSYFHYIKHKLNNICKTSSKQFFYLNHCVCKVLQVMLACYLQASYLQGENWMNIDGNKKKKWQSIYAKKRIFCFIIVIENLTTTTIDQSFHPMTLNSFFLAQQLLKECVDNHWIWIWMISINSWAYSSFCCFPFKHSTFIHQSIMIINGFSCLAFHPFSFFSLSFFIFSFIFYKKKEFCQCYSQPCAFV